MFHVPMGRFQLELINFLLPFLVSSHLTVVLFFPVGLLSLSHFHQVLLGVEVSSVYDNDEKPTRMKNTTIEWDVSEKSNKNK